MVKLTKAEIFQTFQIMPQHKCWDGDTFDNGQMSAMITWNYINIGGDHDKWQMVVIRNRDEQALVFPINYCPLCGEKLNAPTD